MIKDTPLPQSLSYSPPRALVTGQDIGQRTDDVSNPRSPSLTEALGPSQASSPVGCSNSVMGRRKSLPERTMNDQLD